MMCSGRAELQACWAANDLGMLGKLWAFACLGTVSTETVCSLVIDVDTAADVWNAQITRSLRTQRGMYQGRPRGLYAWIHGTMCGNAR